MTVDRLPDSLQEGSKSGRGHDGLPVATILSMCDRLLGEVGRRSHMFTWLRDPDSSAGHWLTVDSYYPRARLVVMCRTVAGPHQALYQQLIPAHGLGLLTLDPAALGGDLPTAEAALAARISGRNLSTASGSSQGTPAGGSNWTPVTVERTPVPTGIQHGLGVALGVVLAALLLAELYLGVVTVGLGAGRPILGLAIALEACSRGLGTLAAERAGHAGWAGACAIVGAPVVAWFALSRRTQRAQAEPAPLAALLALLAAVLALLGLLIGS
jgi:hypothetical protein